MSTIKHHGPPGCTYAQRQALMKWCLRNGGGCWGLWQHAVSTKQERQRTHMKNVRQDRKSQYFPKGTPRKLQWQYYTFIYTHGRCSYEAWLAWATLKGPYPLQYL